MKVDIKMRGKNINKKYKIYDACISCRKCYDNCPVKAISFKEELFRYSIDESKCVKCGKCYRGCVYKSIIETKYSAESN